MINIIKAVKSTALIMTGSESIGDSLISVSILITIVIYNAFEIDLEPWLSVLISLLLIKTGVEMLKECANKLLGARADAELIRNVKRQAARVPGVRSVFNLVIHNYGEGVLVGSVNIAVDNSMSAEESTGLVRKIKRRSEELGVRMASVGVYGISLSNPDHAAMWD